jgi:iron complex transport system substrate-binding protein
MMNDECPGAKLITEFPCFDSAFCIHHSSMKNRIASLLASSTEILYALGLGDRVIAVSHECDFPRDAVGKPRVTMTNIVATAGSREIDTQVGAMLAAGEPLYRIDEALLTSLEPDLIVTQAQCDVCAVKYADVLDFVARGPQPCEVVALNPTSMDEVLADIARVGEACGVPERAAAVMHDLQRRIDAVKDRTADLTPTERPCVGCIEWIDPLYLAANWMPELIDWAGGRQPFARGGVHSTIHAWDEFVAADPECIVVMPCGFDLKRTLAECEQLRQMPCWSKLTAVRRKRVYATDGNAYFNRSGPRLVDSLEILARLVHPSRFGLDEQVAEEPGIWRRL